MHHRFFSGLICVTLLAGCSGDSSADTEVPDTETAAVAADGDATPMGQWDTRLTADEINSGRRDPSWRQVVELDTVGFAADTGGTAESWEDITPESVNNEPMRLPLFGESEGPSTLRAQILLDRVRFSPGIIDGAWGKNTEKAVYWFQSREGIRRSGRIDQETFDRLGELAGAVEELVVSHTLTAEDVEGPFMTIPDDIYEKAELDCMCYESLSEKLTERFHSSVDILNKLNPDVDLDQLAAGDQINVPNVDNPSAGSAQIARLVVSGDGFYLHALDASDRIVYHFPTTLGSSYDPSPSGNHTVASISKDPWWHYQPSILEHVPDDEPEARIPPGPNNAVGMVWMALSIPHYGIHGTSAPETIGYTTSAGCIRLTNWDALFLADQISSGTPVEFSGSGGGAREAA